jgi:hypothetical protein
VTINVAGGGSVEPGSGAYPAGSFLTLTPRAQPGQLFTGWTLDGVYVGYAAPLTLTVDGPHTLVAQFVARPTFADIPASDPDYLAVTTLAALGIINPGGVNGTGRFEPERPVARAEVAAFLARTFGWQGENHPNLFPDQCDPVGTAGCVDDALWKSVAALAQYGVVGGYTDGATCAASGLPAPCYLPRDPVLRIQIVSIVARAFTKTPALRPTSFWDRQPAVSSQYTNVPDSGTQRSDLATYRQNAGPIPEQANDGTFPAPNGVASRRFVIATLWQAFSAQYGFDRVP